MVEPRVDQCDVTHACPPGKGGIAKLDFRRTISSLGLAILTLVDMPEPPEHLLIGSDALGLVRAKLDAMQTSLTSHEELTRSTDMA